MSEQDLAYEMSRLAGLFIGQLTDEERAMFDAAVEAGVAFWDYSGPTAILGLAKVGIR